MKILELLKENPEMPLTEVAATLERTTRAIEMTSAKLVKKGKLKYVGPAKGGHWEAPGGGND